MSDQALGQLRLQLRRQAKADAPCQLPADREINVRIAIAEHVRHQRADQIDIFVAIDVENTTAIAVRDKERSGARRQLYLALRKRLRAKRNDALGTFKQAL